MSKHSPAPWRDVSEERSGRSDPRMYRSSLVATSDGVLAIDCTQSGKTNAQDRANARLISAAPELLEALRVAELEIRRFHEKDGTDRTASMAAAWDVVRAAIAKANGES